MAQRPLAPDKQGARNKVFFGSTFRVLESPHASPCLSFANSPALSPNGYAFSPMPTLGELPPSMPLPASVSPTSQVRPGGSGGGLFDLLPGGAPPATWQVRRDSIGSAPMGLTRQRSGSPGPEPGGYPAARPRPVQLGSPIAASTSPVASSSPVHFARQTSPPGSPAFTRQFSPPGSPAWTTVSNQRRKPGVPGMGVPNVSVKTAAPLQAQEPTLQRLPTTGDSVDLYYDQKEMFVKGWTRDAKSTRSVKQKKRVDYQVEKRRQQSERDRAAMAADYDDSDLE